jgi:hypothetical protein
MRRFSFSSRRILAGGDFMVDGAFPSSHFGLTEPAVRVWSIRRRVFILFSIFALVAGLVLLTAGCARVTPGARRQADRFAQSFS